MQIFINTYGSYLHVKEEMFEIKVPKAEDKKEKKVNHIAAHKVKSIVMSKGCALSSDAIVLALKHNIDIVLVENNGHPMGRFWHSKSGSTSKIRKRQLEASLNEKGLYWIKSWLTTKLSNQIDYLQDLKKHREKIVDQLEERTESIGVLRDKIESTEGKSVDEVADYIRGLEGSAGRHYFEALSLSTPSREKFKGRSSRPAKDRFNALLNYAYGILYSRVERSLVIAGLDPYIGFMHRDDYNSKSMVFDFIEPYRIHAERFVFKQFSGKKMNQANFDELQNGFSLNADGKALFVPHYLDYLETDRIRYAGRNQSRQNAMQFDAHAFANKLIA